MPALENRVARLEEGIDRLRTGSPRGASSQELATSWHGLRPSTNSGSREVAYPFVQWQDLAVCFDKEGQAREARCSGPTALITRPPLLIRPFIPLMIIECVRYALEVSYLSSSPSCLHSFRSPHRVLRCILGCRLSGLRSCSHTMRAWFDTLSLSLPSTTDAGCFLCVLPRFLRRVISIRWRRAYTHPIISSPTIYTFNMISTLVPMDITLSMTFSSLTQQAPCAHVQSYLFHLSGTNHLYFHALLFGP